MASRNLIWLELWYVRDVFFILFYMVGKSPTNIYDTQSEQTTTGEPKKTIIFRFIVQCPLSWLTSIYLGILRNDALVIGEMYTINNCCHGKKKTNTVIG